MARGNITAQERDRRRNPHHLPFIIGEIRIDETKTPRDIAHVVHLIKEVIKMYRVTAPHDGTVSFRVVLQRVSVEPTAPDDDPEARP